MIFTILRHLHAWGAAVLALLMMLVSLTGTLLVWKQEYLWLTVPEARVDFTPDAASLALIGRSVDALFADEQVFNVQFATRELPLTQVQMADNHFAYLDSQGRLVDAWTGNGRFEEWVYDLHHRLLLADTGLDIVGVGAMLMSVLVLIGVVAYWPFRKGFRLGILPRDLGRPQLTKAHRNGGILLALPFLLTLITGIALVYPGQAEDLLLEDIRSSEAYSNAMVEQLDSISGGDSGAWLPALERAEAVFPGAVIRSAQVPGDFSYYRILGLQQAGEWNRQGMSRVYIDAAGGYMDIRMDAQGYPLLERAYNALYPLHTGKMNSLLYKLWLTLVGLGVFALAGMGLYSFVRKYL